MINFPPNIKNIKIIIAILFFFAFCIAFAQSITAPPPVQDKKSPLGDLGAGDLGAVDLGTGEPFIRSTSRTVIYPQFSYEIMFKGASLSGEENSVSKEVEITLSTLHYSELADLGGDMLNVTAEAAGYRFLPDGQKFDKMQKLALQYDKDATRNVSPSDIFTFYYDENLAQWLRLDRDSIDAQNCIIYSHTNHFTDYINAILQAPETPEVQAYTPTMIKDLQAAHPHTGIGQFSMPQANNKGTATTSMPLWLPAGRQGIQPNLSITYNSGGGNGWLGYGWDIAISSIEVETRWGVPLYSDSEETETYLLDGETLVLRDETVQDTIRLKKPTYRRKFEPRKTGNIRFYRRVEGAFQKIERVGKNPKDYYFVVTDKNGTKYFYGQGNNSKLQTDEGNIGKWCLNRIEDTYGNYTNFVYDIKNSHGGKQIYLQHINYTGNREDKGKYNIYFRLAEQRTDITSNARKGVLETSAHLLDRIDIMYKGEKEDIPLRRYYFGYKEGAYGKTLLHNVLDADNTFMTQITYPGFFDPNVFNRNAKNGSEYFPIKYWFNYYEEDSIKFDSTATTINAGNDSYSDIGVTSMSGIANTICGGNNGKPSSLGGSRSMPWSIGGAANVGFGYDAWWKTVSAGGTYSYTGDKNISYLTMLDINGDGYPDKIFKDNYGNLNYRLQEIDEFGNSSFGGIHSISDIDDFNASKSHSHNFGIELQVGATMGVDWSNSHSNTYVYVADVDGDGLPDIVDAENNKIYYNRLNSAGFPTFTHYTAQDTIWIGGACGDNVNYILNNVAVDDSIFIYSERVLDTIVYYDSCYFDNKTNEYICIERFKYIDTEIKFYKPDIQSVRAWVAPYSGEINISGTAKLTDSLHKLRLKYNVLDGVQLSIQKKGSTNVFKRELRLSKEDSINPVTQMDTVINVSAGDIIYFWVESNERKSLDIVEWNQVVEYSNNKPITTNNGANITSLRISEPQNFIFNAADDFVLTSQDRQTYGLSFNGKITGKFALTSNNYSLEEPISFKVYKNGNIIFEDIFVQENIVDNYIISFTNSVLRGDSIRFDLECPGALDWSKIDAKATVYYTTAYDTVPNQDGIMEYQSLDVIDTFSKPGDTVFSTSFSPIINKNTYNYAKLPSQKVYVNINASGKKYFYPEVTGIPIGSILKMTVKDENGVLLACGKYQKNAYPGIHVLDSCIVNNDSLVGNIYIDYYSGNVDYGSILTHISFGKMPFGQNTTLTKHGLYTNYNDYLYTKFGSIYRGWTQFGYKPKDANKAYIDETLLNLDYLNITPEDTVYFHENLPQDTADIHDLQSFEALTPESALNGMGNPLSGNFVVMRPNFEKNRYVAHSEYAAICKDTMYNDVVYDNLEYTIDKIQLESYPIPFVSANETATVVSKMTMTKPFSFRVGLPYMGVSMSNSTTTVVSDYMDMNGDRYPDVIATHQIQFSKPQGGLSETNKPKYDFQAGIDVTNNTAIGATANLGNIAQERDLGFNVKIGKMIGKGKSSNGISGSHGDDDALSTWQDINGDGLPDKVLRGNIVFHNLGYKLSEEPVCMQGGSIRQSHSGTIGMSAGGGIDGVSNISKDFDIIFSISGGLGVSIANNFSNFVLQDMNADGLPDRVSHHDNGELWVSYNKGNDFGYWKLFDNEPTHINKGTSSNFSINAGVTVGFSIGPFPVKLTFSVTGGVSWSVTSDEERLVDFNNDGFPDIVTVGTNGNILVKYAIPQKANLLKSIETPTNYALEVDYQMSKPSNTENPSRSWVMASCTQFDYTLAKENDTTYTQSRNYLAQKTEFEYGSRFYNRFEREDYGYDTVRNKILTDKKTYIYNFDFNHIYNTIDLHYPYRTIENIYNNRHDLFKGLLEKTIVKDSDNHIFTIQDYNYVSCDMTDGQVIDPNSAWCFGSGYPAIAQEQTHHYHGDNSPQIKSQKSYEYGKYGNVTKYFNDGNLEDNNDDISANIHFHEDSQNYIVGIQDSITYFASGQTYRKSSIVNAQGRVTKITQYGEGAIPNAVTEIAYDNYGNIKKITVPSGVGQTKSIFFYYDRDLHSLVIGVADNLGYFSQAIYDPRWQQPIVTIDIGGDTMHYTYDSKGRIKTIQSPKDNVATVIYNYWDLVPYQGNTPKYNLRWVETKNLNQGSGNEYIKVVTHADGFGRVQQIAKHGDLGDGHLYWSITGNSLYDNAGNVLAQSTKPKIVAIVPNNSIPTWYFNVKIDDNISNLTWQRYRYDKFGREIQTIFPDGTTKSTVYKIKNNNFETLVTDANNNTWTTCTDIRGLTIESVSPLGYITQFQYDGLGQLRKTIDPELHETYYKYDILGRTVQTSHPSRGTETYSYDGATSNVKVYTNAKNQTITYTYDAIGRPTTVAYSDNPINNVYYRYGAAGIGSNTGKLIKMQDATGVSDFEYGNMGEVISQTRMHILPNGEWLTHRTEWEYDSWGRTRRITYPDGERLYYHYNNAGNLKSVSSRQGATSDNTYIENIFYNIFEQKDSIVYGNNTKVKYLYDNVMQRLEIQKLYDNAGNIIFHKEYEYDDIGNIKKQENHYNFAGNNYAYKNYYGYDEDNRLTIAHGNTTLPYYALTMEYSPAGRILQKDFYSDILFGSNTVNTSNAFYSNSYDYDSPNPYAVTEAGSDVFCWDELGNMAKKQYGRSLPEFMYWTEDNRMQAYNNIQASKAAFYRYDASGQRELKLTGDIVDIDMMNNKHKTANYNNAVLYAGNLMTVDKSGYKKHYFIENERFLTVIGGGKKGTVLDVNTVLADIVLFVPGRPVAYNGAAALSTNFTTFVREYYINHRNQCVTSARSSYALDWYSDFAKNFPSLPQILNKNFLAGGTDVPYYWHSDYLGSGSAITNSAGNAVQILDYAPFGEDLLDLNNGFETDYKFAGYLKDAESGMNYANARYYNQTTSIFITTDPMWYKYPYLSSYVYANNNPIRYKDPTGEFPIETIWDIGNVLYDVGAAVVNHIKGDHEAAVGNWTDLGLDVIAVLIPYVPAGTTKVIKGAKAIDKAVDGAKTVDKATDAAKIGKYGDIPDPKTVKEGGNFTKTQKKNILEENSKQNGGVITSDQSGKVLDTPTQSKKGQKANMNQAEIDHIDPKSKGGTNSSSNAQVLSKEENLKKGNRINE